ncbi:MAG: S9 family peptidase, partial [Saprospiraceae bacterium]|nr:S9 family peptidase [Saprospiraceae bacterium]
PVIRDQSGMYSLQWRNSEELTFINTDSNFKSQIFSFALKTGDIKQITRHSQGIYGFKWQPGGRSVAFFSRDSLPEKIGWEKHVKSFEAGLNSYLTREMPRPVHLWVCDQNGRNSRQISRGVQSYSSHYGDFDWSPDGTRIAFISQPSAHSSAKYRSEVQVADLDRDTIFTLETRRPVWGIKFMDNRNLICNRPRQPLSLSISSGGLYLIDGERNNGAQDSLDIDADLYVHKVMPEKGKFIAAGAMGTRTKVWLASFSGTPEELELGELVPSDQEMDVHASGAMAIVSATENKYKELFYKESPFAAPVQITHFNLKVSSCAQGRIETISWKSEDGTSCNGVVTYPPDYNPQMQYPLVVAIHGGPVSSSQGELYFYSQLLAAQGWIIFEPNYRGSNNNGEEFLTAIVGDPARGPGEDIISGINTLIRSSTIDTSRIGVMGWSYGGYLCAWLVSQYHFWNSAIMGAGITDHLDMYTLSDVHLFSSSLIGASPWDDMKEFQETSPISYANQVETPLLILSMSGDERVPVTNSYKMFHALRDRGVETKFIVYPMGGHVPSDPAHVRDVRIRMIDWFKNHFGK